MSDNSRQIKHRGIVVSDLHLFARRSRGVARFDAVREDLSKADVVVLNGDIFDFRWSTHGDQSKTLPAAINWLRQLADDLPGCHIHFVIGNHDCTIAFQEALTGLASALPRFQWHEYLLRIGSSLFVHGDCAHRHMNHHGLSRFRKHWQRDFTWSPALAMAYEWVDRFGITQRMNEWQFPRQKTVERIVFYLDNICPGWREQTRHCYFGHTHLPFADYEHDGIQFHNTGSAIHNLEFNPIWFETPNLLLPGQEHARAEGLHHGESGGDDGAFAS